MMIPRALLPLSLAFAANAKHLTFLVTHDRREVSADSMHAHVKRATVNNDVYLPSGNFWYTNMDIGENKNVSMLLDSGTAYTYISTPNLYKPSTDSILFNKTKCPSNTPSDECYYLNRTTWTGFDQTKANGCGSLDFREDVYADTVSWQGLTVKHQRFGVADYTKTNNSGTARINQLPPPYQGLVGLTIGNEDQLGPGGIVLMSNLYKQGQIPEPRYGLAFGTAGTGKIVLGGVDDSLFDGELVNATTDGQWMIERAYLTSKGKTIGEPFGIWFDSGGPSINGPSNQVRALFDDAGVEAVETETVCGKLLYGYYPCDAPPQIGFEINGTNFDIEPAGLRWKDNGANNCTAIVVGDEEKVDGWTVGQPFMQGKYIDHNGLPASSTKKIMGFAKLKNATDPASPRVS